MKKVVSSPKLKMKKETKFLKITQELINYDQHNWMLLSNVDFCYVEAEYLQKVFEHYSVDDINSEIFCQIKKKTLFRVHPKWLSKR
jgi:hypothetical protein